MPVAVVPALAATPSPSPSGIVVEQEECVSQAEGFCRFVYDVTGNRGLAHVADWIVAKPLAILLVVVIALTVRFLVHRAVDRVVGQLAEGKPPRGLRPRGRARRLVDAAQPVASERRKQRSEAVGSVLKSVASFVIVVIAVLMILSELGLDVAPAIASAGIAGVALGFGAQNLVKDFLAGIFMIFEDQYGVGDVINTGEATGTVEGVGLRVTQLRDVNGMVWYVRNGEIVRIGNESQGWARAVLDVGVSPRADIEAVRELLQQTGDDLWRDPDWADKIVEQPEVWGVESVTADSVVVRVTLKTVPAQRVGVMREMRERIKNVLDANGVEMPFPQRAVYLPQTGPAGASAPPPGGPAGTPPADPR